MNSEDLNGNSGKIHVFFMYILMYIDICMYIYIYIYIWCQQ